MFTDKPAQAKTSEKEEGMGVQSGGRGEQKFNCGEKRRGEK